MSSSSGSDKEPIERVSNVYLVTYLSYVTYLNKNHDRISIVMKQLDRHLYQDDK